MAHCQTPGKPLMGKNSFVAKLSQSSAQARKYLSQNHGINPNTRAGNAVAPRLPTTHSSSASPITENSLLEPMPNRADSAQTLHRNQQRPCVRVGGPTVTERHRRKLTQCSAPAINIIGGNNSSTLARGPRSSQPIAWRFKKLRPRSRASDTGPNS